MMRYDSLLSTSSKIIPSNYLTSASDDDKPLVGKGSPITFRRFSKTRTGISTLIRSFLTVVSIPAVLPTCRWLASLPASVSRTPSLGRKVTGTLFGNRRGLVSFAVQCDSRSAPLMIVELAVTTAALVKEMSSGLVRIALECDKGHRGTVGRSGGGKLFNEPSWTMYCNGRKCGYSWSRSCSESDWHVLSTVQSVSVGAGVIPVVEGGRKSDASGGSTSESEGELLYMRASFDRVVGSRDSEAYYMRNPDGTGGPELSIFLLRI